MKKVFITRASKVMLSLLLTFIVFPIAYVYGAEPVGEFCPHCGELLSYQPQEQPTIEFPRTGRWIISGRDQADWTGSIMVIREINDEIFYGYFNWYRWGTNFQGREYFRGVFNPDLRTVIIRGYRLGSANVITWLTTYEAYLAENGYDFESGIWAGGVGRWEARLQR